MNFSGPSYNWSSIHGQIRNCLDEAINSSFDDNLFGDVMRYSSLLANIPNCLYSLVVPGKHGISQVETAIRLSFLIDEMDCMHSCGLQKHSRRRHLLASLPKGT